MRPRGPTWPRNGPLGTETSHTGPCSLNVAQLARSFGWVLVGATFQRAPCLEEHSRHASGIHFRRFPIAICWPYCLLYFLSEGVLRQFLWQHPRTHRNNAPCSMPLLKCRRTIQGCHYGHLNRRRSKLHYHFLETMVARPFVPSFVLQGSRPISTL